MRVEITLCSCPIIYQKLDQTCFNLISCLRNLTLHLKKINNSIINVVINHVSEMMTIYLLHIYPIEIYSKSAIAVLGHMGVFFICMYK